MRNAPIVVALGLRQKAPLYTFFPSSCGMTKSMFGIYCCLFSEIVCWRISPRSSARWAPPVSRSFPSGERA